MDLAAALDERSFALVPASSLEQDTPRNELQPATTVPLVLAWAPDTVRPGARRAIGLLRRMTPIALRPEAARFRR